MEEILLEIPMQKEEIPLEIPLRFQKIPLETPLEDGRRDMAGSLREHVASKNVDYRSVVANHSRPVIHTPSLEVC